MPAAQQPVTRQPATPERAEAGPADAVAVYVNVRRARIQPGEASAATRAAALLTRFDFDLRDNGEGREVLEAVTNLPLSIVLLVDVSSSLKHLNDISSLPADIKRALGPDDRLSVGRFGSGETVFSDFTHDAVALDEAARDLKQATAARGGPSPIWDAVNTAITSLEQQPGRPAIILITDGRVTGNLTRFEFVMQHALASHVTIYSIVWGVPFYNLNLPANADFAQPSRHPRRISLATGGVMVPEPTTKGETRDLIENDIRELRSGHRLSFKPYKPDGKPHMLNIRIRTPGFLVRGPESYTPSRQY